MNCKLIFGINQAPLKKAEIVILPFCYEQGASYGRGSREGPRHLLEASQQIEVLDEETLQNWSLFKIHTLPLFYPPAPPEHAITVMGAKALDIMQTGKFLLCLGGDHAISIGPIISACQQYDKLSVLQIDAHLDLRDQWNGSRYNHACVMRRIIEKCGCKIVQVGIRAICPEEYAFLKRNKLKPFYAHTIDACDSDWIKDIIDALSENVYVTIDLDGLDPAVIPGTGTPEPGGLTYRQLVHIIKRVGAARTVVAADINELCKIPQSCISEFTAAKIATKIMVYCQ